MAYDPISEGGGLQQSPTCFLKMPDIKGDALHKDHPGEIPVKAWSFGGSQNVLMGKSKNTSSVAIENFVFKGTMGQAGPQLLQAMTQGKKFKSATLTCIKPKKTGEESVTYITLELSNVIVAAYNIGQAHGDTVAIDEVSLSYSKIEYKYSTEKTDRTPAGNYTGGWDIASNKVD
jgi:type VI secretion system secreted protein Hcp